jgi:hypothetical protein
MRNTYEILSGKPERDNLGHLAEDDRIILKWVLNECGVRLWDRLG